jgi:hypothetical protein
MKLLIVSLPDLPNHVVACSYNEVATENVECFVMDVHEVDMRSIPANPGDRYRIPHDARVTANLVTALREMITRGME